MNLAAVQRSSDWQTRHQPRAADNEFDKLSVWKEAEPEPVWPEPGSPTRCQCGAELSYPHFVIELPDLKGDVAPAPVPTADGR